MDIDALEPIEKLAFAGLVRLVVRSDGEFTAQEVVALTTVAKAVGSAAFWTTMRHAQERLETADDVMQAVEQVTRPEVRRWIYTILHGIAKSDGIDRQEGEILHWLISAWDLR